jgi:regulator of nucleoside diphosphate kinase
VIDDDLVSALLVKKLKHAAIQPSSKLPPGVVGMRSFLEFVFDGSTRTFAQLAHPSSLCPDYGISVTSLMGAGLIGLRAGQMILWPNSQGTLCDLHVVHVENCPGMSKWVGLR